jgi:serine/threonine-protein kinase
MTEQIGKYRILQRIGRGGMGTVFKADDPVLDRLVALKVISSDIDATEELKARFYREAQACAKLNHPNVVTVHDLGEDQDRLFIVMEFLEGEELKRIIAQRRDLPVERKLGLMVQVCDGLYYAHQKGVIHRDMKPANIFVLRNGQAKILDFGIARLATAQDLTRTGLIMGTLRYMSPEQARGRVDHRSDIFSVGAVFYELLAYRPAFDRQDPIELLEQIRSGDPPPLTEVEPSVPPELAAIIERALRKDPVQRLRDLAQMRDQLQRVLRALERNRDQARNRVRGKLAEVGALQAAVLALLGTPADEDTIPMVDDRMGLAQLVDLD